jgi:hypothetical protein
VIGGLCQGNDDDEDYPATVHEPEYFYPARQLFKMPKQCPKEN